MKTVFVDVREPKEFATGHIPGALNVPPAVLMTGEPPALAALPRDTRLVVYCLSGARSNASMPFLRQFGFTNLVNGINKDQAAARYGTAGDR